MDMKKVRVYRPNTDTLKKVWELHKILKRRPTEEEYLITYGGSRSGAARAVALSHSKHYPNFTEFGVIAENVDAYIRENLPTSSTYIIGAELGLTNEAVRLRAKGMGLKTSKAARTNYCNRCGLPISPQAKGLCKECYDDAINRFNRLRDSG